MNNEENNVAFVIYINGQWDQMNGISYRLLNAALRDIENHAMSHQIIPPRVLQQMAERQRSEAVKEQEELNEPESKTGRIPAKDRNKARGNSSSARTD